MMDTWSMAQGMRHGRSTLPPRGMGNADENDGAACTAGKAWQPMLWLSVKPKMPLTWLCVTNLMVRHRFEQTKQGIDTAARAVTRKGRASKRVIRQHIPGYTGVGEVPERLLTRRGSDFRNETNNESRLARLRGAVQRPGVRKGLILPTPHSSIQ